MSARRYNNIVTICMAAAISFIALRASAQVNEPVPPTTQPPASLPSNASSAQKGGTFVSLFGDYVLNYNADVTGVKANNARGWGYGGAFGSVGPTGGAMIRGEYFPKITVPGDGFDLDTTRFDIELHGFVGAPKIPGLNSLFDLGFKYVHADDKIDAFSFKETEQWYLANLGFDFTLPIGNEHSPFWIFGTVAGLAGGANASGGGPNVSGFAYGYTATAGVALNLWDGAVRITGGYKIQDSRANRDSSSGNVQKIAEDQLQSAFVQITITF